MAANLSDIAAMGGLPRHALLSLLLPPSLEASWIEALYAGVNDEAARWEMTVAGGNISRTSGPLALDVVVLGGGGHVGLPLSLVLADSGARVGIVDIDGPRLERIAAGEMPFMENGADALLTRVGALFHDVGKAMNPTFFIENQAHGCFRRVRCQAPAVASADMASRASP